VRVSYIPNPAQNAAFVARLKSVEIKNVCAMTEMAARRKNTSRIEPSIGNRSSPTDTPVTTCGGGAGE